MTVATDTISIYRGDTYPFAVKVLNYNGTAFDLTGYYMKITARIGTDAPLISEDFACTTDPTLGIAYGELPYTATDIEVSSLYDYDIQISNTDVPPLVYTLAIGKLQILQDVST